MSRTTNGFHAMLWGIARLGFPGPSARKVASVTTYSDPRDTLQVGDIVGQDVWIERGGVRRSIQERYKVTKIDAPRENRGWRVGLWKVRFERFGVVEVNE